MFAKVGQPAVCAKAGIIRLWFRDARVLYQQSHPLRELARSHRGMHFKGGSEPAREDGKSDNP
jgi:hypothetical protein